MVLSKPTQCKLIVAFSIAFAGSVTAFTTPAIAQTAAEKIYAELAKLPAKERHERIVAGAKKEGELNFINSLRGKLGLNHTKLFRKRYPFLKVNMSELGSQDAAQRIFAEEAAGRHLTDVVGIAVPDISDLLSKDVEANYPTPATKRILKQYRKFIDPKNRWTPWEQSEHGIAYNTNLVKNPPKSYMDLCDPRFKGQISFEPLEVRFLTGLYEVFDENFGKVQEWLSCIAKNKPIIQRGHTARLRLMLSGDHAISPDQYLYNGTKMKRKNPSVPFAADYQTPVVLFANAQVINKNTPHPYAAALYVDWCLSDESQKYVAKAYRGPVALKHPYFPDDVKLVPFNYVSQQVVDKLEAAWKKTIVSHK